MAYNRTQKYTGGIFSWVGIFLAAGNTGKTYVMANGNTAATFGNTSNIAGNIHTAAANVDNTDAKATGNIHILSKFNFSIR